MKAEVTGIGRKGRMWKREGAGGASMIQISSWLQSHHHRNFWQTQLLRAVAISGSEKAWANGWGSTLLLWAWISGLNQNGYTKCYLLLPKLSTAVYIYIYKCASPSNPPSPPQWSWFPPPPLVVGVCCVEGGTRCSK